MIHILIPVYNAAEHLAECLETVIEQTYQEFEVIMVDDGSTDDSLAICKAYCDKDARFKLYEIPHGGVAVARNEALAHVEKTGDHWVTFVDADDLLEPDYLTYLVHIRNKTGCAISGCNHLVVTETGYFAAFPIAERIRMYNEKQAFHKVLYHEAIDVSPWGKLYHSSLFEGLQYPEGMIFEDTWMFGELLKKSYTIAMGYVPMYYYHYRDTSLSKLAFRENKLDYIKAVYHLTELAMATSNALKPGCVRRNVHAALSVRRFLVDCGKEQKGIRKQIDRMIKRQGVSVLLNPKAPLRDKIGIAMIYMGDFAYDVAWKLYCKVRYH